MALTRVSRRFLYMRYDKEAEKVTLLYIFWYRMENVRIVLNDLVSCWGGMD